MLRVCFRGLLRSLLRGCPTSLFLLDGGPLKNAYTHMSSLPKLLIPKLRSVYGDQYWTVLQQAPIKGTHILMNLGKSSCANTGHLMQVRLHLSSMKSLGMAFWRSNNTGASITTNTTGGCISLPGFKVWGLNKYKFHVQVDVRCPSDARSMGLWDLNIGTPKALNLTGYVLGLYIMAEASKAIARRRDARKLWGPHSVGIAPGSCGIRS